MDSTYTVYCRVCIVYYDDLVAVWELWLTARAQHGESTLSLFTSPGKHQNSEYDFTDYASNLHHYKAEKLKSSHSKLETVCNSLNNTGLLGLEEIAIFE